MDTAIDLKQKIHDFIDVADERMLRIINAIISSEEEEASLIDEVFYQELDKRRQRHLTGESKTFSWAEVQQRARESAKRNNLISNI